ncbi:nitrite reductase small subunit NirD [Polaribacter sp. Asnod1-A03]|uniref:nitrite reductase small subunit NirD n=1 Tax=Polaribacter sp. Asnod1-A03 TaxID=3160581 RepID=UPI00386B4F28
MEGILEKYKTTKLEDVKVWFKAASINAFPKDGGACVKYKDLQIAVFNFERLNTWYACQNLSPEKQEMVLSRGMIGDHNGIPKVACPLHKKTFSLETGENLNGDLDPIAIYPVKIDEENVYIGFSD